MRYALISLAALLASTSACGSDHSSTTSAADGGGASSAATYAAVSAILGGPDHPGIGTGGCAASVCHGGDGSGHAGMNFKTATDLHAALVNVPACENSSLMRVKPGDPEHSWLWIKLTADIDNPSDGLINYSGQPSSCAGVGTGFGTRMPQVGGYDKLSDAQLAQIKTWIEDGAPGPH